MLTSVQVLENYKQLFENLNLQSVEEDFLQVFSDDVYFKDPFNAVHGLATMQTIFRHMFSTLHEPKFRILDLASQPQPRLFRVCNLPLGSKPMPSSK